MKPVNSEHAAFGIGCYTVPEAARLLKIAPLNIRRWLGGYSYKASGEEAFSPPLWTPQLPKIESHIELGFRDLIELRFVAAFLKAGLNLFTIRSCLQYARECVNDDRPFSTRRFQTDGKTIFLEGLQRSGETELLDLKRRQYALKDIIEGSFKELDIEHDAVVRWRPFNGKHSIVIDPKRSFGQPIAAQYGVPTVTLCEALEAEKSVERVAFLYEVSTSAVKDAAQYEKQLQAA
ncbi:hypothetical protein [Rhodoblastus sp.]